VERASTRKEPDHFGNGVHVRAERSFRMPPVYFRKSLLPLPVRLRAWHRLRSINIVPSRKSMKTEAAHLPRKGHGG
jgi:hypothetical protein